MALQIALTDSAVGYTFPASYVRVANVNVDAGNGYIGVVWHADKQARDDNKNPVKSEIRFCLRSDLPGDIYPAAYNYLKSLPEFAGAIDV